MPAKKTIIKVYSTPNCPYCHQAKDFLKSKKVSFKDINVAENRKSANEMIELSGQMSVPVIVIDKDIIIGFDANKLKALLKRNKLV